MACPLLMTSLSPAQILNRRYGQIADRWKEDTSLLDLCSDPLATERTAKNAKQEQICPPYPCIYHLRAQPTITSTV